ncbi:hypothetical protein ACIA8G_26935 [Lentzea sp. NPDC051213]|uniref:hypothetical protein n=1 Tax=Lentzea sp. NPDC051213 TaxID=3364126 RepID=UPI0037BC44F9
MVAKLRALAVPGQTLGTAASRSVLASVTLLVAEFLQKEARTTGDRIPFWKHLNASPSDVARIYVDLVASNPSGVLSNLPRINAKPGVGREGLFNGLLFQRYALNHVKLHEDLRIIANGQVHELNARLTTSSGGLIDAHAADLNLIGKFGAPRRATNFWLSTPREEGAEIPTLATVDRAAQYDWDEWIDCAYVSPLILGDQAKTLYWTIAVGLEVKRPGAAASGLSPQIGGMLGRIQESDMVRMALDGSNAFTFVPARAFVFLPESRWLVGATPSLTNTPEYDFVSTKRGGYPEAYLRLRIRFDTSPVDRLSTLLFNAVL